MRKIIVSGLLILSIATSLYAKNLGVWGTTFPVAEQDIKEFIHTRLYQMQKHGELDKIKTRFISNVKQHILRPTPVAGITTTNNPKTFYYDPTYFLAKTIEDDKGRVIAPAGLTINPLSTVTLHSVLFFLNADDKRQIMWSLEHAKEHDYIKYILVGGNIKEAGEALNDRIYFDQEGLITKQLGIKHVPCIVKQQDKKLQIQEFSLDKAKNKSAEKNVPSN